MGGFMTLVFKFISLAFIVFGSQASWAQSSRGEIVVLKQKIVSLAQSFQGQADPDQSLQKRLEVLTNELILKSPMPPVKDRLSLVAGAWKQVWGPYDYSNDDGGIDPTLGIFEIYQVVSEKGYYYNVSPFFPGGDKTKEQVALLRGEYVLDPQNKNSLNVRFTDYPGVDPRPQDINLWELAAMAEDGTLENQITIVPSPVVQQFFKGGTLEEVYTDQDLRILYGKKLPPSTRRFLYVMTRMN